jgi:hypothetical protein
MTRTEAEQDMMSGFLDGYDMTAPEPSANRSHSYRHGFANGRDDRAKKPRASAQWLRARAEACIAADVTGVESDILRRIA